MSSTQLLPLLLSDATGIDGVASSRESGVSMKMDVGNESLRKDKSSTLDALESEAKDKRPHKGSLSWPAENKKERGKPMRRQRETLCETYKMPGRLLSLCQVLAANLLLLASLACTRAGAQVVEADRAHPSLSKQRICVSLRVLASEARKQTFGREVETLAGIGWLEGFVVDPDSHDVILIGRQATKWPTLHIDDLVVNMQNIWNRERYPYCSLDPRPEDVRKLIDLAEKAGVMDSVDEMHGFFKQLREAWGPQSVVVGGVPRNSRHARVMIDADYHMKKVSQGLVQVEGVRSCLDILLDEAKTQMKRTSRIPSPGMSMSRFWFHVGKGEPSYEESERIVCLDRCSVVLLTEKQRSTTDGSLSDSGEDDPRAKVFAQELSDRFQKAAALVPEYADLENLFRLSAVLRAMFLRGALERARLDLSLLLKDYNYRKETEMPSSLPGLANSKEAQGDTSEGGQYVMFPMACGGVSMEIAIDKDRFAVTKRKELNRLRGCVLGSRPSSESLAWDLPVALK